MLGSFQKNATHGSTKTPTKPGSDERMIAQPIAEENQDARLADMSFRFPLRKYQQEILTLINVKLERGERQFHIVAPPGAGKTIIGLQIVSQFKCPSLILSPNTTIQSQWGQKLDLFLPPGMEALAGSDILGTHADKPLKPITLLTYQVLSTPGREQEYLDKLAHQCWVNELTKGRSMSVGDAELRVLEIMQNNPKAHSKEISRHVSRLRKKLTEVLDLKDVLHPNAIELLQSLRRQKFGVVIFDECHHLTDYWAAIMTHLVKQLGDPIIIGLTGTPPEGKSASQEGRYLALVGDIDYQVPTPALVREGGLAPFQDLVYFTEPTEQEFQFLEEQHAEFHVLINYLTTAQEQMPTLPPVPVESATNETEADAAIHAHTHTLSGGATNAPTARTARSKTGDDEYAGELNADGTTDDGFAQPDDSIVLTNGLDDDISALTAHAEKSYASPAADFLKEAQEKALTSVRLQAELAAAKERALNADGPCSSRKSGGKKINLGSNRDSDGLSGSASTPGHMSAHDQSGQSTAQIASPLSILSKWINERFAQIVAIDPKNPDLAWRIFSQENIELSRAISRYIWKDRLNIGFKLAQSEVMQQEPNLEDWMLLLEDMASRKLKLSASSLDHDLYERIRSATRKLGYAITEQGLRRQASPVDRVLAFSNSKPQAVAEIIELEFRSLEDRLRAAVVTDFEKMSATSVKSVRGILDEESGGAIAVMRTLLAHPISAFVNPCLVTGSLLLTDKRITQSFVECARELLLKDGHLLNLIVKEEEGTGYSAISAAGSDWESKLYVGLATAIFERGITKCLIGTRGLFGEGWDSQALNTLIDLTTTTSPVSVKQLRGRSIRIQTNDPLFVRKVANNWDVVCIAPQLEKGLNDYQRFVRKHDGYFGLCDDGQIESGVGHVHPSLSELTPVEVFASSQQFNQEMTDRALVRDKIYDLWKVGQPYRNSLLGCVELHRLRKLNLTPPHIRRDLKYKEHARQLSLALYATWFEYGAIGGAIGGAASLTVLNLGAPLLAGPAAGPLLFGLGIVPVLLSLFLASKKYSSLFNKFQREVCQPNTQESSLTDIAFAVLTAMQTVKLLPQTVTKSSIKTSIRSDGSYRVFLDNIEPAQSKIFTNSLKETFSPVISQPYLIPKYEYFVGDDDEGAGKKEKDFFRRYLRGRAEPRVACYHPVPSLLARSEKGRAAFETSWNKYVSPGFIVATETKPELLNRYFGLGPSLAQRLLWE